MKPFYIVMVNGAAQPKQWDDFNQAEQDALKQLRSNPSGVYFVMEAKVMLKYPSQPVERVELSK